MSTSNITGTAVHPDHKNDMLAKEKFANCFRPFLSLAISGFGALMTSFSLVMVKKFDDISLLVIITARSAIPLLIAITIIFFRLSMAKLPSIFVYRFSFNYALIFPLNPFSIF